MGQTAVDLPDPLETPPPAPGGGTDDLLAQLAGEEIDRLLADSDSSPQRVPVSPAATKAAALPSTQSLPHDAAPTPPAAAQSHAAPFESQQSRDAQPASVTTAPATSTSKESDPELAAALDSLLTDLDEQPDSSAATDSAPGSGAESSSLLDGHAPRAASEVEETATTSRERDALRPEGGLEEQAGIDSIASDEGGEVSPLPLYLRPLEWLNAPLARYPASVREAIGKIAILTLVNAVAVLIYVLFIRRG